MTGAGDVAPGRAPSVALFVTCVVDLVRPDAAVAAVALLRAAGSAVSCPTGQTCCGQPAWNAGFADEAAAVARTSMEALERDPAEHVVVPAGSCATMIRRYWPQLFALAGRPGEAERAQRVAERTLELSEFLATPRPPTARPDDARSSSSPPQGPVDDHSGQPDHGGEPEGGGLEGPGTLAYHRSCHLERELHVTEQPTTLLTEATGMPPAPWGADDACCGFGGTFSVRLPEVSVAMADEKLNGLPAGVDTVVSCDASCLLHLEARARERGLSLRFRHLAEVLVDHLDDPADGAGPRAGRGGDPDG